MADAHTAKTTLRGGASLALIAVVVAGFALWWLRGILTPLVLAVFMLIVVDAAANSLIRRAGLSSWAALWVALALVLAAFVGAIWLIVDNAAQMVTESSRFGPRLDQLLKLSAAKFGMSEAPTLGQLVHQVNPAKYIGTLAGGVGSVAESAFLVLIYLGFMLASRSRFSGKLDVLFARGEGRANAHILIGRIKNGIEGYVWVQTVVGLVLASASAILMTMLGMSHIWFWAFLIFLAAYVPIIGGAVGIFFPVLFALIELPELWKPVVLFVGLQTVHMLVGNVITPRLQGERLNIDPIVVVVALVFWGLLWGVPGAFLSTPMTVLIMAVCAQFPGTRGVAVMLSADGQPFADTEED